MVNQRLWIAAVDEVTRQRFSQVGHGSILPLSFMHIPEYEVGFSEYGVAS